MVFSHFPRRLGLAWIAHSSDVDSIYWAVAFTNCSPRPVCQLILPANLNIHEPLRERPRRVGAGGVAILPFCRPLPPYRKSLSVESSHSRNSSPREIIESRPITRRKINSVSKIAQRTFSLASARPVSVPFAHSLSCLLLSTPARYSR